MRKKLKVLCLLAVAVVAGCSCTTTNGDMAERMVTYDSITISIDYPYISDYVQVHPYERADTLFMLGYNHWTHSVDMILCRGSSDAEIRLGITDLSKL